MRHKYFQKTFSILLGLFSVSAKLSYAKLTGSFSVRRNSFTVRTSFFLHSYFYNAGFECFLVSKIKLLNALFCRFVSEHEVSKIFILVTF